MPDFDNLFTPSAEGSDDPGRRPDDEPVVLASRSGLLRLTFAPFWDWETQQIVRELRGLVDALTDAANNLEAKLEHEGGGTP